MKLRYKVLAVVFVLLYVFIDFDTFSAADVSYATYEVADYLSQNVQRTATNLTAVQTLPEIESIQIEKVDEKYILNFLSFGIYGNGKVNVTVEAVGSDYLQETTIYLGESDGEYDSMVAEPEFREDGIYHYTAVFQYDVPQSAEQLKAYAVNSSGVGSEFTRISGISDVDNENKTIDSQPFVLENTEPEIAIDGIESNYVQIKCDISISDVDSGIAKVEYGWDLDRTLCDDKKNVQSGQYQGFRENNYTDQYVIYSFDNSEMVYDLNFTSVLNYEDSVWVKNNQHKIYLRVTDNAGNVKCVSFQDPVGSDMLPPNITDIEISKAPKSNADSVLRFLSYGTFSNDSVTIVVSADDNESVEGTYVSGIQSVMINSSPMIKNKAGEYTLTVSAADMLSEMEITVADNAGWVTKMLAARIPNKEGLIKSNDLFVENDKPSIIWNFSSEGHLDNYGRIWYGKEEAEDKLEIIISDDVGVVGSGLYAVKVTDNDETIYTMPKLNSIELQHMATIQIGDLADGSHTIVVTAEDNAGNTVTDSKTFYIDSILPEGGNISIIGSEGLTIDGQHWYDADEIISFRVDCSDSDSGLSCVKLQINDKFFSFEGNKILSGEDGNYVIISTRDIDIDDEHKYTVSGVITDAANNALVLKPFSVYKDLCNPVISKFTVEVSDKALNKGLNVLPFGTFSNDTLVLKAYASDVEFDSGIDYVTVLYDGLDIPEKMTDEGDGVFSVEIAANAEVIEYEFSLNAYDKFGRSSTTCPNLEDATTGDLADCRFVMIEAISPCLTFDFLTEDGGGFSDQMWYNTNHSIELKVQDETSGLRNVDFFVNEIDITSDKNGVDLLKAAETELLDMGITEEQYYIFDTDYLTDVAGEPDDGKYLINIEVTDNAGNVNAYEMIYYIDMLVPQIDKIAFEPMTADGIKDTTEFMNELDYGFYFQNDFTITVFISDEEPSAGLDQLQYRFVPYQDGVMQEEVTGYQKILDDKVELTAPSGFKGQIFVEAFDKLGNRSGEISTKAYVVDNSAPIVDIINNVSTPYRDAEGNALYVVKNSITVEVTDTVSGLKEIGYSQSAEQDSYDRMNIVLNNTYHKVGDNVGDGWIVSAVDKNLVTKVAKTFEFDSDDNNVILTFDATDNSFNSVANQHSDMFTVDKTDPIINVSFRADEGINGYYNQNRIADITVIERNFDASLIAIEIENQFGAVPTFSFSEQSITEHAAVIIFDEGDYTLDVTGRDLGSHESIVNYSGENEKYFFVDKTSPVIEADFDILVNAATENSFNDDLSIHIQMTEHNFDPFLAQLLIFKKAGGEEHNTNGLVDATYEVLRDTSWSSSGDVHTISFTVSEDAVYQVEFAPIDLAGNSAERKSSVVFEIDKTAPVVTAKNEMPVSADTTESIEIYPYSRKDDPAPTVEFDDLNFDHLNYALTAYIPDHTSLEADTVIRPNKVYLEEDSNGTGMIMDNKFVLPDFAEDGVYALELVAVDVAGNESLLNVNTYARMIDQDVLAYIMDSNLAKASGLYSFQYENGVAISKKPDDFEDIQICVMAREDSNVDIVLRDGNGNDINTNAQAEINNSVYGLAIYNFILSADFFKENFQDDTDMQLILTVRNEGNRIDLGKMHIDNIAPTCDIPEDFKSWHWYYGEDTRTVTLSNISELVDEEQCKVYDNGEEVAFVYSSDDNTLQFSLDKGWHNVGVVLSDMAGNSYYIQEKSNIYIGFFWLWVIIATATVLVILAICIVVHNIKKRHSVEDSI